MHVRIRLRHGFQELSFCSSRKSSIAESTLRDYYGVAMSLSLALVLLFITDY